jgi:hypothetical protein
MNITEFLLHNGGEASAGPAIGRLGIAGQFFTLDGQPFTVIESSEFSLFKRYLDGNDIRPILNQRAALGVNTLRVWLLNDSVVAFRNGFQQDGIHPNQDPQFYVKLRTFVGTVCAAFVVEVTVFTSTGTLMPDEGDQQAHLSETADALRGLPNALLELVNESDQYDNAPREGLILRSDGLIASRGSNGSDSPPPHHDKPWHYELYHTNGLDEFQRKVGHNAMEWADQSRKPCVSNENTRYPDNDSSETHAYDAAMGGALLCAGSCFHSQGGKFSRLFDATEKRCAAAWVAGATSVPLEFQRGRYLHRTELEGPDCIRAYERRLPDGRGHVIRIRP